MFLRSQQWYQSWLFFGSFSLIDPFGLFYSFTIIALVSFNKNLWMHVFIFLFTKKVYICGLGFKVLILLSLSFFGNYVIVLNSKTTF